MADIIEGPQAYQIARRRAAHSHYDWVAWIGRDDARRAARMSAEVIKMAMLATGTQKHFIVYERRTGQGHITYWPMANHFRRLLLKGFYY